MGEKSAVGYSGPTFAAVRSGKHCSSTALSHGRDIEHLLTLKEFDKLTKTESGEIKPVWFTTVDGGPDENPRFQKTIDVAIHHFCENNLDVCCVGSNAPGLSCYNRAERRMPLFSHEIAGVVLPHDHYGSHLDSQGRTVDLALEVQNFQFAGMTLAEIWDTLVINGYAVVSEYVEPEVSAIEESSLIRKSLQWQMEHVRTSQYF